MDTTLIRECVKTLRLKNWKIAFVESATAGRMCSEFALVPDSGDVLIGGLSCYKVFVKEKILDVPHDLIEKYTPESAEVTRALAQNAAPFFKSEVTVAVTGLVSPGGSETKEKPVGTMFVHLIFPNSYIAHREVFDGSPEEIVVKTIEKTAKLLNDRLHKD